MKNKNEYGKTWKYFKENVARKAVVIGVVFLLIAGSATTYFANNTESASTILNNYYNSLEGVMNEEGGISLIGLFLNNIFACAVSIGMGLIPFIFLPILSLITNSAAIGAVLGYGSGMGAMVIWKTVVYGLLPHGIFELPAMFISMAMGFNLCYTLTNRIFGKKDKKVLREINESARIFVLIVLPLLIVAALMECFVTPYILNYM